MQKKLNLPEGPPIKLTVPQLLSTLATTKEQYNEWGRGGGKSTIISWRVKEIVKYMPRAKCGIVGSTYQQLLTRTLPSTVEGLELLGFVKDLHYFVGRRPPKEWKWMEAHQPPLSYDNYITFYNGTGFQLISLDNPDSGRGINLDAVIGDEAALMDFEKLSYNVLLSNRGNIHRFRNIWLHHSLMFSSTTPVTMKGRWFIQQEENARQDPANITYLIASSEYNLENLGPEFFKTNKRLLTPLMYNAEILCIRPGRVQTGFYPAFDEEHHTYEASNTSYVQKLNYDITRLRGKIPDADLIRNAPIELACDYGAKINTVVCGQPHGEEYNLVNALFVKSPKTIMDLSHTFCDYYADHGCKEVEYWYDHTAVARDAARTTTFAEEFIKVLESRGWKVRPHYVGQAPKHATKYLFFDNIFKEQERNLPRVRINADNCKYLVASIQQAGAREGRNGIEKDKRPEQQHNAIDEETTHFSDAFDTLVYWRFKDGLAPAGYFV